MIDGGSLNVLSTVNVMFLTVLSRSVVNCNTRCDVRENVFPATEDSLPAREELPLVLTLELALELALALDLELALELALALDLELALELALEVEVLPVDAEDEFAVEVDIAEFAVVLSLC